MVLRSNELELSDWFIFGRSLSSPEELPQTPLSFLFSKLEKKGMNSAIRKREMEWKKNEPFAAHLRAAG